MAASDKPRSHRKPKDSTVQQLLATAFRCGEPTCQRPLFLLAEETGVFVRNCQIAHICARSENGPRWDADMTEEENRSPLNLLPLCLEHAFAIDQDNVVHLYPVDLLLDWKREQLEEYQRIQRGWGQLTDDEIREVSEASFDALATGNVQAVLAAARIGQRLVDTARSSRSGPRSVSDRYQRQLEAAQRGIVTIDDDGNRIPLGIRLSDSETGQFEAELSAELVAAVGTVEPLVEDLRAEVAAIAASGGEPTSPRCQWLLDATDLLRVEVGRWRADDDQALDVAVVSFEEALTAVVSHARGDAAQEPPRKATELSETEAEAQQRTTAELTSSIEALLAAASPWARVEHRPYDDEIHGALIAISPAVDQLPSTLGRSLQQLSELAARVARNATDDEIATVLARIADVRELHIRLILLRHLNELHHSSRAVSDQLERTQDAIKKVVPSLADGSEFWSGRPYWLLDVLAEEDLPAAAAAVTQALEAGRLCEVLSSLGQVASVSGVEGQLIIHPAMYRAIAYVNADDLRVAIAARFPSVEPARPPFSSSIGDDCQRLASEFLFAVGDRPSG